MCEGAPPVPTACMDMGACMDACTRPERRYPVGGAPLTFFEALARA